MNGFLQRALTAAVFVIIMLGGIFGGPYTYVSLFGVITGLCLWEFFYLLLENERPVDQVRKIIGLVLGMLPFTVTALFKLQIIALPTTPDTSFLVAFAPLLFLLFLFELFAGSERPFANIGFLLLGFFYIGIPFTLLNVIGFSGYSYQMSVVLGLVLLTWANDTGAYLVGSQIGYHKLWPRISPKKTWEGTLGAIGINLIIAYPLSLLFPELSLFNWLALAAIVSIFGSLGDLVESMLKRSHTVKDSGSLLPGHGGLLDRFDGFLFMLPFAATYLLFFI